MAAGMSTKPVGHGKQNTSAVVDGNRGGGIIYRISVVIALSSQTDVGNSKIPDILKACH
jgi:hypothetical protein